MAAPCVGDVFARFDASRGIRAGERRFGDGGHQDRDLACRTPLIWVAGATRLSSRIRTEFVEFCTGSSAHTAGWGRDLTLAPAALFSCAGQVAIVTGAGTGIGRTCAEALAAAGARVVIAGLPASQPEVAAAELVEQGLEAVGAECDVTDAAAAAPLVETTVQRWGRIDTVLANAGAALDQPGADDALERIDRMYALHVRSSRRSPSSRSR